jgi:hypothetical protein
MALAVAAVLRRIPAWSPWVQLASLVFCGLIVFFTVLAAISWRRLEADLHWLFTTGQNARVELS